MKRVLCLLACSVASVCAADLAAVRTIYVMPMPRGLDQHLASHIASGHIFQVVTDPKLADAVLTDRVGEVLNTRLDNIFAKDEDEEEPAAPADAKDKSKAAPSKKGEPLVGSPAADVGMFTNTVNRVDNPAANSTFGRAKGTIFLVDAKSREVVWSTYDPPKSARGNDLNRTASDIVSRLKKDLKPKKQ